MDDKRFFNLSMNSITIEAKDHFDASMQFFNLHEGIGLLLIQEMKGADKIGDLVNIRNTMKEHDDDIITGLCEISNRCPNCYNKVDGAQCTKCQEYYAECTCKKLSRKQIEDVFRE